MVSFRNPNENKKMKLFLLILSLVRSECPTALTWQKTGDSGILKWAQPAGHLNVKLTVKQSSLPIEDIQEMIDTREHVPFTVGVLFQQCLPDIKILSEFKQVGYV